MSRPTVTSRPPASQRPPFPLIAESTVMQQFIRLVRKRSAPLQIVPIIVHEDDRLETDALFGHILCLKHITPEGLKSSYTWMIIRESMHDPEDLERMPAILFKRGERISASIQSRFCAKDAIRRYQHIDVILMLLEPNDPRPDGRKSAIRKEWIHGFSSSFSQPLEWPAWKDRTTDHKKFFLAAHERLTLPSNRMHPIPALPRETLDYLCEKEFTGTVQAEQFLKAGFSSYLRMDPNGNVPLLVEHFETIRSLRPPSAILSTVHAQRSEPPAA